MKKTLDSFDWSWPKKINRLQVQNLFRLRFLDDASNVVLVGGVGLGTPYLIVSSTTPTSSTSKENPCARPADR